MRATAKRLLSSCRRAGRRPVRRSAIHPDPRLRRHAGRPGRGSSMPARQISRGSTRACSPCPGTSRRGRNCGRWSAPSDLPRSAANRPAGFRAARAGSVCDGAAALRPSAAGPAGSIDGFVDTVELAASAEASKGPARSSLLFVYWPGNGLEVAAAAANRRRSSAGVLGKGSKCAAIFCQSDGVRARSWRSAQPCPVQ